VKLKQATIYTKPGCPYCAAAKDDLTRRGIRYVEHNVEADPVALRRMLERNGGRRHVPTLVQDGQVTVGFHGY
jgi:glutaredoxin 3